MDVAPDATGVLVRHYNLFSNAACHLARMNCVLSHADKHFKHCTDFISKDKLRETRGLCKTTAAKLLFRNVKPVQRYLVKDWNPNCDKVTQSSNLNIS